MRSGSGGVALANVVRWTLARTWLAILLAAAIIVDFGTYGIRHPAPDYGAGLTILDEQMQRSHTLVPTDVLLTGDSTALHDIDTLTLERALEGPRVDNLAAIGPARPQGYARLVSNYLSRREQPRIIILLLHPLGLMHGMDRHKRPEMQAILADAWPARSFTEEAVKALNLHLFGGLLEEPLAGVHGTYYGTGRELRRAIRDNRGSLIRPSGPPLSSNANGFGILYSIAPETRQDLIDMREQLGDPEALGVYVGLTPGPSSIEGPRSLRTRDRVFAEVLELLGLPPSHGLSLPATYGPDRFADLTHLNEKGRMDLTRALAATLRRLLDRPGSMGGGAREGFTPRGWTGTPPRERSGS